MGVYRGAGLGLRVTCLSPHLLRILIIVPLADSKGKLQRGPQVCSMHRDCSTKYRKLPRVNKTGEKLSLQLVDSTGLLLCCGSRSDFTSARGVCNIAPFLQLTICLQPLYHLPTATKNKSKYDFAAIASPTKHGASKGALFARLLLSDVGPA